MSGRVLPDFTMSRPIRQPIYFLASTYFRYAVEVTVQNYELLIIIIIIICTNKCTYIYIKILNYNTNAPTCFGAFAPSSGRFDIPFAKVVKCKTY